MHFIVDADSLCYRAAAAADKREYSIVFNDEVFRFKYKKEIVGFVQFNGLNEADIQFTKIPDPVEGAIHNLKSLIVDIIELPECDSIEFHLSSDLSYRKHLATTYPYKGNRKQEDKPTHLIPCREYLISEYGAIVNDWIEADDAVSIRAREEPEAAIVHIDKDLLMIPGVHYNWVTRTWYTVDSVEAIRHFYHQLLMGDATDNIHGISGIGEVTAKSLLKDAKTEYEMYTIVKHEYIEEYGPDWLTMLRENGRLLWLLTNLNEVWNIPKADGKTNTTT